MKTLKIVEISTILFLAVGIVCMLVCTAVDCTRTQASLCSTPQACRVYVDSYDNRGGDGDDSGSGSGVTRTPALDPLRSV